MFKRSKSKHLNLLNVYEKAENLFDEIPVVKRRRRRKKMFKFLKYFVYSFVSLAVIVLIIFGNQILNTKKLVSSALDGKRNIEQAVLLASNENFEQAILFSDEAVLNFDYSLEKSREIKNSFFIIIFIWPDFHHLTLMNMFWRDFH